MKSRIFQSTRSGVDIKGLLVKTLSEEVILHLFPNSQVTPKSSKLSELLSVNFTFQKVRKFFVPPSSRLHHNIPITNANLSSRLVSNHGFRDDGTDHSYRPQLYPLPFVTSGTSNNDLERSPSRPTSCLYPTCSR